MIWGKKDTEAGKQVANSEIKADNKLENDMIFGIELFDKYSEDIIASNK